MKKPIIAYVDHDKKWCDIVKKYLSFHFSVEVFSSVETAKQAHLKNPFRVIVSEVTVEFHNDGFELIRTLRKQKQPALLFTKAQTIIPPFVQKSTQSLNTLFKYINQLID